MRFTGKSVSHNLQISIIIVSYNTRELLTDCLKSIAVSTKEFETETFVVDNNSKDETVKTVKSKFPWVNLTANPTNVGFSRANNQALKRAKGKYILILNPDTKLLPDTLSKMYDLMENRPDETAVATCKVELPFGGLDKDCRRRFPTPWRAMTHFSGLSKLFPKSNIFAQYYMGDIPISEEHEVDACVGAFMFIRKNAIDKVGYFDEDFFFYGEDLDLCFRFKDAGYKILYTPITKIIHYKGAASGLKSHSRHLSKATVESKRNAIRESVRAMRLFYQKHYKHKYPGIITHPVLWAVKMIEIIRLAKLTL